MKQKDMQSKIENWTEELTVAGEELAAVMQSLLKDASVHRLKIVNKRTEETVIDIPAVVGLPVAVIGNVWTLISAAVLWAADFTVIIERRPADKGQQVEDIDVTMSAEAEETAIDVVDESSVEEQIVVGAAEDVHPENGAASADDVKATVAEEPEAVVYEQCQGVTLSGEQCKRKPMTGSAYCYAHQPE